ncbi:hypothetical protein D3C85_1682520 [compost metagenome]
MNAHDNRDRPVQRRSGSKGDSLADRMLFVMRNGRGRCYHCITIRVCRAGCPNMADTAGNQQQQVTANGYRRQFNIIKIIFK